MTFLMFLLGLLTFGIATPVPADELTFNATEHAAALVARWDHTGGGPFCSGQSPGFCTLAWEQFRMPGFLPGLGGKIEDKACIYDFACNPLCNEKQQVAGYHLRYDSAPLPPAPLFHFDTYHNGPLGAVITIDWYDYEGQGDGSAQIPIFQFKGHEYGGFNGACTCGSTGLDQYGIWACGCSFPCGWPS